MPVIYKLKPVGVSSSNKTQIVSALKKENIAYWYKKDDGGKVWVTLPFIDKISVTVPVHAKWRQQAIREGLYEAVKKGAESSVSNAIKIKPYKIAVNFIESVSGESIHIAADPEGNAAFLRLEFNPAAIGSSGMQGLKNVLHSITFTGFEWPMVLKGRATRIDIAVDLLNVAADELLVWHGPIAAMDKGQGKGAQKKSHIYVGGLGDVQTVYGGLNANGQSGFKMYNKSLQIAETNGLPGHEGVVTTRVELSIRGSTQKVSNLLQLDNKLAGIGVLHPQSVPAGIDSLLWVLFLDSCRLRGVQNALQKLPKEHLSMFHNALTLTESCIWRPEKLWLCWPFVLNNSELLTA